MNELLEKFRELFPEFDSLSDSLVEMYLELAGSIFGACQTAQLYLTAHLIALDKANGIGQAGTSPTKARLVGGVLPLLSVIDIITDGSLIMNSIDVTGIDFTSVLSYEDVATTLQTELENLNINVTVAYEDVTQSFIIENVIAGSSEILTYAFSYISGTDLSSVFSLSSATAISLTQGTNEITGGATIDGGMGETTSEKVGELQVTLKAMAESGLETYYTSTAYGRRYLALKKVCPTYVYSPRVFMSGTANS